MYISKKWFYIITGMFLLIPLSVQWQLLVLGKKTKAEVIGYAKSTQYGTQTLEFTVLEYKVNGQVYTTAGPEFVEYPVGKEIWIYYKANDPEKILLFTMSGLLLSNKMIIPAVLLIVWFAFYASIKHSQVTKTKKRFNYSKELPFLKK